MRRICLIHWKAEEAEEKIAKLRAAGYEVDCPEMKPGALRDWRNNPPSAFVIDLSRMPSQGRDVAVALRVYKTTPTLPRPAALSWREGPRGGGMWRLRGGFIRPPEPRPWSSSMASRKKSNA